jgi:hypothetical protein
VTRIAIHWVCSKTMVLAHRKQYPRCCMHLSCARVTRRRSSALHKRERCGSNLQGRHVLHCPTKLVSGRDRYRFSDGRQLQTSASQRLAGQSESLHELTTAYCRSNPALSHFAGHNEKRLHLEALVVGPQPVNVVLLFHVHDLFGGGYGINRHVVVTAVP